MVARVVLLLVVCLAGGLPAELAARAENCGMKPFPRPGCKTGRCVDGHWEQQCDSRSGLACGMKPIPRPGCSPARCDNGVWKQDCARAGDHACGLKPPARKGCRVGDCVDGRWQQLCE